MIFFKALNHIIRTFARPAISTLMYYKKSYFISNKTKVGTVYYIMKFFVHFGQKSYQLNQKINKKVFNLSNGNNNNNNNLLTEDKALEYGVEMFSEIIIYVLLISIPIYEYKKSSEALYKKKLQKDKLFDYFHKETLRLSNLNEDRILQLNYLSKEIDKKILYLNNLNNKSSNSLLQRKDFDNVLVDSNEEINNSNEYQEYINKKQTDLNKTRELLDYNKYKNKHNEE